MWVAKEIPSCWPTLMDASRSETIQRTFEAALDSKGEGCCHQLAMCAWPKGMEVTMEVPALVNWTPHFRGKAAPTLIL